MHLRPVNIEQNDVFPSNLRAQLVHVVLWGQKSAEYVAPTGLELLFGPWFYKYVAPNGAAAIRAINQAIHVRFAIPKDRGADIYVENTPKEI